MAILVSVGEGLPTYPLLMDEPLVGERRRFGDRKTKARKTEGTKPMIGFCCIIQLREKLVVCVPSTSFGFKPNPGTNRGWVFFLSLSY